MGSHQPLPRMFPGIKKKQAPEPPETCAKLHASELSTVSARKAAPTGGIHYCKWPILPAR
jgi:hypothetical protein